METWNLFEFLIRDRAKFESFTIMRDIFIRAKSPLRGFLPWVKKLRYGAWKFQDRLGVRLVISGGKVKFMDVELEFPEGVGLHYSTPLYWNGPDAYECQTSRTIALLAGKSELFLDIGSNVGIYAIYVGKRFPQVKIFAFEPIPAIWQKNRRFHQANQLPDDTVFNLALGDREGPQTIFLPVHETGWEEEQTATLRQDLWQTREQHVEKIEIQCTTLDAFAASHEPMPGLCLLKIDVENYESAVLRGGKNFIAARRPWIVCEILSGQDIDVSTKTRKNNNDEVAALIHEFGYAVFAITSHGLFRMTINDFSRPREFKDFLLVPAERISDQVLYLTPGDAAGLFDS
jgi:FkbM family methyltransferase